MPKYKIGDRVRMAFVKESWHDYFKRLYKDKATGIIISVTDSGLHKVKWLVTYEEYSQAL